MEALRLLKNSLTKYLFLTLKKLFPLSPLKTPSLFFKKKPNLKNYQAPSTKTVEENGPDHRKRSSLFAVHLDGKQVSTGKGKNKQEAEQKAAQKALKLV